MTTKTIQIDGMKGDTCVKNVSGALRGLNGVEVKSVSVGTAVLDCADDAACEAACTAISDAGYEAMPSDRGSDMKGAGQQKSGQPTTQGIGRSVAPEGERGTPSREPGSKAREGSGQQQSGSTGTGGSQQPQQQKSPPTQPQRNDAGRSGGNR